MHLLQFLGARTAADSEARRAAAIAELESVFNPAEWGIEVDVSLYTTDNKANLWRNELRRPIQRALVAAGVDEAGYGSWLPEIHYVTIGVYRRAVFAEHKANIGWRVALIGVPAVEVAAIGIASHYQGGQRHNQLGAASNVLYDAATGGIQALAASVSFPGRKVTAHDWDKDGLIRHPVASIKGISIATAAGTSSLNLKDVRTTTVKKILASYLAIESLSTRAPAHTVTPVLHSYRQAGAALADVYPFRTTEEFEPVRSLALQDLAAASLRIQLRRKSSTRTRVSVYYGPPGTGKTLTAVREAVKLADPAFEATDPEASFARFNELGRQLAFITFHQALQYEDAIESIRPEVRESNAPAVSDDPVVGDDGGDAGVFSGPRLAYRVHEGLFLRMIRRAARQPKDDFVIVVDEINRGDLSRILGPLISAIEPDKRAGAEFPIGVELQYPKAESLESRLYLPPNIHILGTMNSADRNIALVDHALRRRFDFIWCPPEPSLLGPTTDNESIDLRRLLEALNARIQHLLDSDHCLGHGYFMSCKTNSDVIEVMAKRVIPLLREYFYGNMGLMLLALGDTVKGTHNIFRIFEPEHSFEEIFGVDPAIAARLGYRSHDAELTFQLDPRFWDHSLAIPGPGNETYACAAIRKIYSALAS